MVEQYQRNRVQLEVIKLSDEASKVMLSVFGDNLVEFNDLIKTLTKLGDML